MTYNSFLRITAIGIFAVSVLSLPGCVVGNAISDGYENFITYFNAYYDAQKLFSDAEDEIQTAALQARGKSVPVELDLIPGSAKQKLNLVIDKCSNIMAYHPTSSLVDDALLMTGKSFYYMGEYRKAERKFEELLVQYPNSSLLLETQLWLARSKDKLRNNKDAIQVAEALLASAQKNNDKNMQSDAARLLGSLYQKNGMFDESKKYYDLSIQCGTDDEKAQAELALGDEYFTNARYEQAMETYLKVVQYTSDNYTQYYCKLQTAVAYRKMKLFDQSEQLLTTMANDFHYKEYMPVIYFERAITYAANGKIADAANAFFIIDTTYAKTEYAYRSALELARIYEKDNGLRDYKLALKYYSEAGSTIQDTNKAANKKSLALTRYFSSYQTFHQTDSLQVLLADTSTQALSDSLQKIMADTLARAKNDTTIKKIQAAIAAKRKLPSADSLMVLKSIAAHELGDVFYDDIEDLDSANVWYSQALRYHYDSVRSPRVLFILAEISRTPAGKAYSTSDEYYTRLDHDFPESLYAEEARRLLGREHAGASKSDTAAERYRQAEQFVDAKVYDQARTLFASIPGQFPKSPLAPKSDYAVAWVWENGLLNNDSALAQYRYVVKRYPGTLFAAEASKRIIEQADTTKKDTTALRTVSPIPSPPAIPSNGKLNMQPEIPDSSGRVRSPIPTEIRKPRVPVKDIDAN
jgi:tetratricopeptide (TPR) repeat protein